MAGLTLAPRIVPPAGACRPSHYPWRPDGDDRRAPGHHLRGPLPARAQARERGHGRRLARRGPGARAQGRDQDPPRALCERHAVRRAVPARGDARRRALAPERRLDLRQGRGRGLVFHRHGVRRGTDAQGADRHPRPVPRPRRDLLRPPGAGRAPLRAPERDRPPRHQAAQRARRPRGPRQGRGLRHRAGGLEPDDRGRLDHRHGAVPLARAGSRRACRRVVRPLLDRDHALRAPDRRGAVHRRDAGRDRHEAPVPGPARALDDPPRDPARPRPRRRPRARQGARRPLPLGEGDGPRSRARRPRRRGRAGDRGGRDDGAARASRPPRRPSPRGPPDTEATSAIAPTRGR